jgi:hypothetical protein
VNICSLKESKNPAARPVNSEQVFTVNGYIQETVVS